MKQARMMATCFLVAAVVVTFADATAQVAPGSDVLGLYFDIGGEYTNDLPSSSSLVYAHILITNPSRAAMHGCEFTVVVPSNVSVLDWGYPATALDVFSNPNFSMGLAVPVPAQDSRIITNALTLFVNPGDGSYIYLQPLGFSAPYPLYVAPYPEIIELKVSSGRYGLPVAVVNSASMLAPACWIEHAALDFGNVIVGQAVDQTVKVANTGGRLLDVLLATDNPDFAIGNDSEHYYLGLNDTIDVQVRYAPSSPGSDTCTLNIGSAGCGTIICTGWGASIAAEIAATSPPANEIGATNDTDVSVTFQNDKATEAFTDSTFVVSSPLRGTLAGVLTYEGGTRTASFNPDTPFLPVEHVTAGLTSEVFKSGDKSLGPGFSWRFRAKATVGLGEFTPPVDYVAGSRAADANAGDIDHDGDLDIVYCGSGATSIFALINDGTGVFPENRTIPCGEAKSRVTTADLDQDGDLDLVCAPRSGEEYRMLSVLLNDGTGQFTVAYECSTDWWPAEICADDLDGDGCPDVALLTYDVDVYADNLLIYRNLGDGTLAAPAVYPVSTTGGEVLATFLATGDVNADGFVDLAVSLPELNTVSILTNNGTGVFDDLAQVTVDDYPEQVALADMNGDGSLDILTANRAYGDATIVTNDGTGQFSDRTDIPVGTTPTSLIPVDLDGDDDLDFLCAGRSPENRLFVMHNEGSLNFSEAQTLALSDRALALAVGDLNGDGRVDVAIPQDYTQIVSVAFNVDPLSGSDEHNLPSLPRLAQNVPNPFNPMTTISFSLPRDQMVQLVIYSVQGRVVRRLIDGKQEVGAHEVIWDGLNDRGQTTPSGAYFYRLVTADHEQTRKMMLVR